MGNGGIIRDNKKTFRELVEEISENPNWTESLISLAEPFHKG